MNEIALEHIQKAFGEKEILRDVTLYAGYGERIGIVGDNGSGKSTLLHILAGLEKADGGTIRLSKNTSVALLRQDSQPEGVQEVSGEVQRYLKLLSSDRAEGKLSGGERTKLGLSKLLARQASVLLLDEPTNNLDFAGISVLLYLLEEFSGTVIAVSHDRYFLDQMAKKVIEIEDGVSTEYTGNYTAYREEKERRFSQAVHRYEDEKKQQKKIEEAITQVKQWSEKAHRDSTLPDNSAPKKGLKEFKRKKAKMMDKKVKNTVKRLEAMKARGEEKPREETNVYFQIKSSGKHGKRILQAEGLTKRFGKRELFTDSDFSINYGEKVAVFGPNGCGKTTLVNMILGEEPVDGGSLWCSPSSQPFILHQSFLKLPESKTVLEFFQQSFGALSGQDRTLLHNMGLTARQIAQKIGTLSFGEKMKVKMGESILKNQDFLILDEPTNHLDLHSREMLEETLREYAGTLLLVSHDIYFLQAVCDKVLLFEDSKIKRLEYSFREYLEKESMA